MKIYSEDELNLYLDAELTVEQERELEQYLTQDAQARRYVDAWSGLRRLIQGSGEIEASADFVDDVMSKLGLAQEESSTAEATELTESMSWSSVLGSKLGTWFFPAVQLVCSFWLLFYSQSGQATSAIDSDMVLLSGLQGEVTQRDYSPLPFDMSTALGFSTEGL